MSRGRGREGAAVARREELAELEQVGAVGVERVAGEAALELEVGEEVEDEALEARIGPAVPFSRGCSVRRSLP